MWQTERQVHPSVSRRQLLGREASAELDAGVRGGGLRLRPGRHGHLLAPAAERRAGARRRRGRHRKPVREGHRGARGEILYKLSHYRLSSTCPSVANLASYGYEYECGLQIQILLQTTLHSTITQYITQSDADPVQFRPAIVCIVPELELLQDI